MKTLVNDVCIGCGLCEGICSEVYHMIDNGVAEAISDEVPSEFEEKVAEATEGCPVNAIETQ